MGRWGDGEMGRSHKGRFFRFGSCPTPNPRPVGGGSQGKEKENNKEMMIEERCSAVLGRQRGLGEAAPSCGGFPHERLPWSPP
ncbi:hypothetical protein BJP34_32625 [Moorena producens PAL-8-15-08-1]|uniref:Uncharacterized protein n=1 Tax=Moorena producens PAL-8-15-08-1 TaxID=1458985 RepID=A0A1D8U0Z8_9CYAN|nr:hypothetical protein BJP34_32625 [Moorena producens PAL-8-15-08-1]